MMRRTILPILMAVTTAIAACGGRPPEPVAERTGTTTPFRTQLTAPTGPPPTLVVPLPTVPGANSTRENGGSVKVEIDERVLFALNSAELPVAADQVLKPIVDAAVDGRARADVTGYASADGDLAANGRLAANRAIAVARRLNYLGLPPDRVAHRGGGVLGTATDPPAQLSINRRVEILLIPQAA